MTSTVLVLACGLAAAAPTRPPLLVFRGNVVLTDDVYATVLDLPAEFVVDRVGAVVVRDRLTEFLHRSGYELARVEAVVEGEHVRVEIDEGRVDKLVLSGEGGLRTVQLLLSLGLPYNVFNRPYLERQLELVRAQTGVEVDRIELVSLPDVDHQGPQLEKLGTVVDDLGRFIGHPLLPPRSKYEVHVFFKHRDWSNGFGLAAAFGGTDGLTLGTDYRGSRAFLPGDRWQLGARASAKLRNRIEDLSSYPSLQAASVDGRWFTPPLWLGLRPALVARTALTSRQRPDVNLESYQLLQAQLALGLTYDLFAGATLGIGAGAEWRSVFGLVPVDGLAPPAEVQRRTDLLPFLGLVADVVFDVDEIRRDRHHELVLENRHYPRGSGTGYGVTTLRYQRIYERGWHDLWLTARGAWLWGNTPFFDEQPVGGTHVRGVFDARWYTRHVMSVGSEVRLSITRDLYKVGLFTDLAAFGQRDRTSGGETGRLVGAFGPSLHVLIADAFQLDIYYAIGIASRHDVERGLSVGLEQAF